MKLFLLIIFVIAGSISAEPLKEAHWREDLKYLAEQLPVRHANAFHSVSPEEFHAAVAALNAKIPTLNRNQIITGLMRIVTMIGDGHTSLSPLFDSSLGFHFLPVQLYFYRDGLFVQKAGPQHKELVGARVVSIGNATVEQVYAAAAEITPHDNEMGVRSFAPFFMMMPEVLNGLGFIEEIESVPFVFEISGKRVAKVLRPAGMIQSLRHGAPMNLSGWIDAAPSALPLYLRRQNDAYWFEYLSPGKTVYVQYNQVRDSEDESFADFAKRVFEFVDNNEVERFVLDVRFNLGGNNYLNKPILLGMIQAKKINQKGKLFVVIGRNTFSAAQNLVNEIEKYTNAIFVGEPTAQNVNFYGDHTPVVLPNSNIHVMVSTLWWQNMDPRDSRKWTKPQIVAEVTSEDYKKGIDPVFDAIKMCRYDSIVPLLQDEMDFTARKTKIVAFRNQPGHGCVNIEGELNAFGYQMLQKNHLDQAIEIFKLNTEFYPESSNAYDSLGEAYLKASKHALAEENYRKAVELNPENENAKKILESLTNHNHQ